jgi:ribosomal protein S18 acetylase RimI-like enzyme
MQLRSLGYRTDLIFAAFDGEVSDHGDHLAIRTPSNPTFYWGNFLLYNAPPREGEFDKWREAFTREIGTPPPIAHQAFGWDTPANDSGDIRPFLAEEFSLQHNRVLTTNQPHPPPHRAADVEIRPLRWDEEWAQVVENQVLCRDGNHTPDATRLFTRRQIARYQKMIAAGMGLWYGAFLGDRLAADLGVFRKERLGRYQAVQTHPEFRNRGIAGTLICQAAEDAFARYGLETLVIVSEADTPADRLYVNCGFQATEHQMGVIKRSMKDEL